MSRQLWRIILPVVVVGAAAGLIVWRYSGTGQTPTTYPSPPPTPAPAAAPRWEGPPAFRDVTAGSGIDFTYRNGEEADQFTILESLGGGVALLDYDGDGLLDVFVTGGGSFDGPDRKQVRGLPCRLYRNLGGWTFEDVTEKVGLAGVSWWYTHGAAVADYDRDGWPDLLVTGYGRLALFHNDPDGKGGRRFTDVTVKLGLKDESWSTSAAFADADGDGFPDLYVCHYVDWSFANHPACQGDLPGVARQVCPPQRFKPLVHAFFWNDKGKGFRDATAEQGFKPVGCGLGVVAADLNDDGRPDFYVANDATNNQLYFNRGGRLDERGFTAGVALDDEGGYDGSMGVDVGDFDGSGRASLFVTNFQGDIHALYQNLGKDLFQHKTRACGIAAIGEHYVGFGTGFVDFDNDGWEDIAIVNGHVIRHPFGGSSYQQRPVLLRNVDRGGRRFFVEEPGRGGPFFDRPALGRGLAVGDLDNDGWPDLVAVPTNGPVTLLRNGSAEAENNSWAGVTLVGKDNRCVVGSTVRLEAGGRTLTRFAKGGGSYLSAGDSRLLFGLGPAGRPGRVTVRWSWGEAQTFEGLESGAYWELREGEVKPIRKSRPPVR